MSSSSFFPAVRASVFNEWNNTVKKQKTADDLSVSKRKLGYISKVIISKYQKYRSQSFALICRKKLAMARNSSMKPIKMEWHQKQTQYCWWRSEYFERGDTSQRQVGVGMGTTEIRHRNPSQLYSVIYACTCRCNAISCAESLLTSELLMQSPGCCVTKALCCLSLCFSNGSVSDPDSGVTLHTSWGWSTTCCGVRLDCLLPGVLLS